MTAKTIIEKLLFAPPAMAAVDASHASALGDFNWSNWAIVATLGAIVYFLKRFIASVDAYKELVDEIRVDLASVMQHQRDCSAFWGRRRVDKEEPQIQEGFRKE